MMEILQVLKYQLEQGPREAKFSGLGPHANTQESDMTSDSLVTPEEASDLLHTGHVDEFLALVHEAET